MPIEYRGVRLDMAYRLDLIIDGLVLVELKAVERILPVHEAQLLSYLRLSGLHVALMINFNVTHLRDGIRRLVHRFDDESGG